MKKILFSLLAATAFFLIGCLEITQEISLNDDGSGILSNTNDMSALMGIFRQMGNEAEMKGADQVIDSTISMKEGADSIPNLTAEEREIARKGTLHINMEMKNDKSSTRMTYPFSFPAEITGYQKLSGKIMSDTNRFRFAACAASDPRWNPTRTPNEKEPGKPGPSRHALPAVISAEP